jgi:DNA polymerase-3 subunit delta
MPSIEKLAERIARGKPVPAIVLEGTDAYLLGLCRTNIIETYVPGGARDWAVTRIAVRDSGWDEVLQRAQTLPMLASCQVIVVEGVESVEDLGDASRDKIVEALGSYLASPAPFTVLVLEAEHLDRRQKFAKLLADKAFFVELTIGGE